MNKRAIAGLVKHGDFIVLDLLCLQLCYTVSYWLNVTFANPYVVGRYRYQALVLLAGMITATTNIVTKSRDKMTKYYEENARLEKMTGDKKNLTLSITGTEAEKIEVTVTAFTNEEFGNTPVIAYGIG